MADLTNLGKKAEEKVREWLNRPEQGLCFDRIPDQLTGFYGSANICDFTLFKEPHMYYIESKATYDDNFPFNRLTDYQYTHMLEKSKIAGVKSLVVVLFATYKRAFILDIRDIEQSIKSNSKSINIKKVNKWKIPYIELKTVPSRKALLDYDVNQIDEIFK